MPLLFFLFIKPYSFLLLTWFSHSWWKPLITFLLSVFILAVLSYQSTCLPGFPDQRPCWVCLICKLMLPIDRSLTSLMRRPNAKRQSVCLTFEDTFCQISFREGDKNSSELISYALRSILLSVMRLLLPLVSWVNWIYIYRWVIIRLCNLISASSLQQIAFVLPFILQLNSHNLPWFVILCSIFPLHLIKITFL